MATLNTSLTDARRLQRRRALADALRKQALGPDTIQHPYQGMAKLAQAWVANRLDKKAEEDEKTAEEEFRETIAKALSGKVTETTYNEIPGWTNDQGDPVQSVFNQQQTTRDMTIQEKIAALPPELAGPMTVQMLGAEHAASLPTDKERELAMLRNIDPELADEYVQKTFGFAPRDAENFARVGSNGQPDPSTVVSAIPGSPEFDALVNEPGMVRVGTPGFRQERTEVPWSGSDRKDFVEMQAATNSTFFSLDEMDRIVSAGGDPGSMVANLALGVDSLANQLHRGYELFTGGLSDRHLTTANRYGGLSDRINLKEAVLHDGTVVDLSNAYNQFVGLSAEAKAVGIGLSYAMARREDPGGRLSEADVLWQMERLRLTSGSPKQIEAALGIIRRQTANDYLFRSDRLPKELSDSVDAGLVNRARGYAAERSPYGVTPFILDGVEYPEGAQLFNEEDGWVYTIKNGQPVRDRPLP